MSRRMGEAADRSMIPAGYDSQMPVRCKTEYKNRPYPINSDRVVCCSDDYSGIMMPPKYSGFPSLSLITKPLVEHTTYVPSALRAR